MTQLLQGCGQVVGREGGPVSHAGLDAPDYGRHSQARPRLQRVQLHQHICGPSSPGCLHGLKHQGLGLRLAVQWIGLPGSVMTLLLCTCAAPVAQLWRA